MSTKKTASVKKTKSASESGGAKYRRAELPATTQQDESNPKDTIANSAEYFFDSFSRPITPTSSLTLREALTQQTQRLNENAPSFLKRLHSHSPHITLDIPKPPSPSETQSVPLIKLKKYREFLFELPTFAQIESLMRDVLYSTEHKGSAVDMMRGKRLKEIIVSFSSLTGSRSVKFEATGNTVLCLFSIDTHDFMYTVLVVTIDRSTGERKKRESPDQEERKFVKSCVGSVVSYYYSTCPCDI
jgi:hypothetical protein